MKLNQYLKIIYFVLTIIILNKKGQLWELNLRQFYATLSIGYLEDKLFSIIEADYDANFLWIF